MPAFTVKEATQKSTKQTDYGQMQSIELVLQEYGVAETTKAEWYTKGTTPLPQPGSQLEGELHPSQYGLKFKKTPVGGPPRAGGRSPEETRQIVRQHSQMVALQYATLRHAQGKLQDFTWNDFKKIIDAFDRDALEGWK